MKRIYLDYAAATPAAREVVTAMEPYFSEKFGNSGSLHAFGQHAKKALSDSRETIARELNASVREIVFTGSATEANNIIIRGVAKRIETNSPRFIISAIEHESVSETADDIAKDNAEVIIIPVSKDGIIKIDELREALNEKTVLVSIIYASNVIGTTQPIRKIAEVIKKFRGESRRIYPLFHVDAVQAFSFFKLDVEELGVDALTLSGQKIYGPKGAGILYIKEGWIPRVAPLITGGMQEFGFRAGTVNTPAIVGLARAVELVADKRKKESDRIEKLRDSFLKNLKKEIPGIKINGSLENRLPNNLNIYFPDKDAQELLIALDQAGVAVSIGSACSVRAAKPSSAVLALGFSETRARQSIRISFGYPTTEGEISEAIKIIAGTAA